MCMYHELHEAAMTTDYFRIWNGLDKLVTNNSLYWRAEYARMQILQAEGSSRDQSLIEPANPPASAYSLPLSQSIYHLSRSVGEIEQAAASIQHLFRGKLRGKTADKLNRQAKLVRELLETFQEVKTELNATCTLFKTKCEVLHNLYLSCDDFIARIASVRRSLVGDKYCADNAALLHQQEIKLRALRIKAASWRDNPNQELAEPMREYVSQCQEVDRALKTVLRSALQSCLDHGLIVFNRQGRMLSADSAYFGI